jgi:hypothetical protein
MGGYKEEMIKDKINDLQEQYDAGILFWMSKGGSGKLLQHMDKTHIMNCVELLHKRNPGTVGKKWIELLLFELSNRGNDWWN